MSYFVELSPQQALDVQKLDWTIQELETQLSRSEEELMQVSAYCTRSSEWWFGGIVC